MQAWSLDQEDPLEEGMAIHSSILAGKISWTGAYWATVHGVESSQTRLKAYERYAFGALFFHLEIAQTRIEWMDLL